MALSNDNFNVSETLLAIDTKKDWKKLKSTKWDKIICLTKYLLQDDNCLKDFMDEFTRNFKIPNYVPPADTLQIDKVVIFQEFMYHSTALQCVSIESNQFSVSKAAYCIKKSLGLHRINYILLNGSMSIK